MKLTLLFMVLVMTITSSLSAQIDDQSLIDYLDATLEQALSEKETRIENWKSQYEDLDETDNAMELLGYRPPDFLISIADIASYLYQKTGEQRYAEQTRDILVSMADYREYFPEKMRQRVEYSRGVPVVNWFRTLPIFVTCLERTLPADIYSEADMDILEQSVAASVDIIFAFPEWSAMNRAMLRAESLMSAALAFPDHPRAPQWKKMATILASDTIESWEIEDAQIYHPVWLRPYVHFLTLTDQSARLKSPMVRFYFEYFVSLLTPNRIIPEFGDSRWADQTGSYYVLLERGATIYQSGEMKWAAQELFDRLMDRQQDGTLKALQTPGIGTARLLISSDRFADPDLVPTVPHYGSGDALEEVITKKVVFRSDWSEDATYLMLNYKDEGYYSLRQKEYLKRILAVEEEKMHHGHSDENSICLFMKDKTVLLKDGNYRDRAPSGEYGAYRADIFHNRVVVRNVKKAYNQTTFDILRNSGAYDTRVRTTKIDFQSFPEVNYSRTRWQHLHHGVEWDRSLLHHKQDDYVVVIDALKFNRSDYFTLANLWHTRQIIQEGDSWMVTRIDQMAGGRYTNPGNSMDLLLIFPQDRTIKTQKEYRDQQDELAIFQDTSRFYDAGSTESFITILYPIPTGADPEPIVDRFSLLRDDQAGIAVVDSALQYTHILGVKGDLDLDLLDSELRPRYNYESSRVSYGPLETDAEMFFVDASEPTVRFGATLLVKLVYNGETLFDTPKSQFFQVWGRSDHSGRAKWRRWDNYPVSMETTTSKP